jgi:hypothetical protein
MVFQLTNVCQLNIWPVQGLRAMHLPLIGASRRSLRAAASAAAPCSEHRGVLPFYLHGTAPGHGGNQNESKITSPTFY